MLNANNDTVKLINKLLKDGQPVEMVTGKTDEIGKGSFIVQTKDLKTFEKDYYFESKPLEPSEELEVESLKQTKVALNGSPQLEYSLKELKFDLVDKEEASIIVSDGEEFESNNLKNKSFIGIGYKALNAVKESDVVPDFDIDHTEKGHEGLLKATTNEHLITSG
ncbi:MAG: hypothetical protein ACTH83_04705 [Lactococcus cremoris]